MILMPKKYIFIPDPVLTGKKIKEMRSKLINKNGKKYTVNDLSEKLRNDYCADAEVKTINKWEQGKGFPSIDNLIYLSEIFKISLQELLLPNGCCVCNSDFKYNDIILGGGYGPDVIGVPSDLDEIISGKEYMDYLVQKCIFSYLTEAEKKIFILNVKKYYDISLFGSKYFSDLEENSIYNFINIYVKEKYGLKIKQNIPTDEEFNSIMYDVLKLFTRKHAYCYSREDAPYSISPFLASSYVIGEKYIDKYISILTQIEKDCLLTALVTSINKHFKKLDYIYQKLIDNGAKLIMWDDLKTGFLNNEEYEKFKNEIIADKPVNINSRYEYYKNYGFTMDNLLSEEDCLNYYIILETTSQKMKEIITHVMNLNKEEYLNCRTSVNHYKYLDQIKEIYGECYYD